MSKKLLVLLLAAVMTFPALSYAQNARLTALGAPSTGITFLIDDVSDVLTYPGDVIPNADMVQGAVGVGNTSTAPFVFVNNFASTGYAYGAKSLMDGMLSIGLVFGQPSYLAGHYAAGSNFGNTAYVSYAGSAAGSGLGQTYTAAIAALPGFGTYLTSNPGSAANLPTNVGHLLVGYSLGDIGLGIDVFREASNSSSKSDGSDITPVAGAVVEQVSKTSAMGLKAGVSMPIGDISLKASAGFIMPGHSSEGKTDAGGGLEEKIDAIAGSYLPISAKASMPFGDHKFTGGLDFVMDGYQFEASTEAAGVTTSLKSPTWSNMHMGIGVADEISIGSNTKAYTALSYIRSSQTIDAEVTGQDNQLTTNTANIFPLMSVGLEQTIPNFWKLDKLILRAGGSKNVFWTSYHQEGGNAAEVDNSSNATPSAFAWTTGVAITKGAFQLEMVVDPTTWNGVHFIGNGAGPVGVNITMTYDFGGASSGSSSSGGYEAPPAYEPPPSSPIDESEPSPLEF